MTTTVRAATEDDLDDLTALFRAYLDFYGRSHDRDDARGYLADRLHGGDSVVHVAIDGEVLVGFTQCYPGWSSLDLRPLWVLEDLFVVPDARRGGVAADLIEVTGRGARAAGACRLVLETQHINTGAISVYDRLGFVRDDEFATYTLEFDSG